MAQATITSQVHQSFDVHGHVRPELAFDFVFRVNGFPDIIDLLFCQAASRERRVDSGFVKNLSGSAGTDTVNIGQCNPRVLILW